MTVELTAGNHSKESATSNENKWKNTLIKGFRISPSLLAMVESECQARKTHFSEFIRHNPARLHGLPTQGLRNAITDLAKDGVLQRIKAPTLVLTGDQSKLQSVEQALQYQRLIPNSRLVVLRSDAYHIAAVNAEECVANVLSFIREARQKA
jgi:pimeloyl-ACP methyl ester carboxylesterase